MFVYHLWLNLEHVKRINCKETSIFRHILEKKKKHSELVFLSNPLPKERRVGGTRKLSPQCTDKHFEFVRASVKLAPPLFSIQFDT